MFDVASIAVGASLLAVVASGSLLVFFVRDLRFRNPQAGHLHTDLTNMTILFQTMRDIVSEQKDLARQFNESLDRKVAEVRGLVESAREEREELRGVQEEIAAVLAETRAKLAGLRGHLADVDGGPPEAGDAGGGRPGAADAQAVETPLSPPVAIPLRGQEGARQADEARGAGPILRVVGEEEAEAEDPDDLIDSWTGIDFVGDEPAPRGYEIPETAPEEPEDAEGARNAFRALLDLEPGPRDAGALRSSSGGTPGNGKGNRTVLQRRVYEYSDAGMTVGDIAGELGVGKGEVRLILSLRKDRER